VLTIVLTTLVDDLAAIAYQVVAYIFIRSRTELEILVNCLLDQTCRRGRKLAAGSSNETRTVEPKHALF